MSDINVMNMLVYFGLLVVEMNKQVSLHSTVDGMHGNANSANLCD